MIEDRDENGERRDEDSNAYQTPFAREPSGHPVKFGSYQSRQHDQDQGSDKTRDQLPARQADLPKGPNGGEGKRADVGVESRDPPFDHKITRGDKHRADQNVIEASPKQREVSTTNCEDETEQCENRAQHRG